MISRASAGSQHQLQGDASKVFNSHRKLLNIDIEQVETHNNLPTLGTGLSGLGSGLILQRHALSLTQRTVSGGKGLYHRRSADFT